MSSLLALLRNLSLITWMLMKKVFILIYIILMAMFLVAACHDGCGPHFAGGLAVVLASMVLLVVVTSLWAVALELYSSKTSIRTYLGFSLDDLRAFNDRAMAGAFPKE